MKSKIVVGKSSSLYIIEATRVNYIEQVGRHIIFHTNNEETLVCADIKEIKNLGIPGFISFGAGIIINIDRIESIVNNEVSFFDCNTKYAVGLKKGIAIRKEIKNHFQIIH